MSHVDPSASILDVSVATTSQPMAWRATARLAYVPRVLYQATVRLPARPSHDRNLRKTMWIQQHHPKEGITIITPSRYAEENYDSLMPVGSM